MIPGVWQFNSSNLFSHRLGSQTLLYAWPNVAIQRLVPAFAGVRPGPDTWRTNVTGLHTTICHMRCPEIPKYLYLDICIHTIRKRGFSFECERDLSCASNKSYSYNIHPTRFYAPAWYRNHLVFHARYLANGLLPSMSAMKDDQGPNYCTDHLSCCGSIHNEHSDRDVCTSRSEA